MEKETNKLIAKFMGETEQTYPLLSHLNERNYHTDWNELMPVIEKISRIEYDRSEDGIDTAYPRTFGMLNMDGRPMVRINRYGLHEADTLIEATYAAVVEFIEHNNSIEPIESQSISDMTAAQLNKIDAFQNKKRGFKEDERERFRNY